MLMVAMATLGVAADALLRSPRVLSEFPTKLVGCQKTSRPISLLMELSARCVKLLALTEHEREALRVLEFRMQTAGAMLRKTELSRSTLYDALDSLAARGIAIKGHNGAKNIYHGHRVLRRLNDSLFRIGD